MPGDGFVQNWVRKAENSPTFRYTIKLPRDLSHDMLLRDVQASFYYIESFDASVIAPIENAGKIGAVLLQLPPYFGHNNVRNLLAFLDKVDTSRMRYAVEMRHRDLYHDKNLAKDLAGMGVAVVDLDSPEKPLSSIDSLTDWGYVRLHGRNRSAWEDPNSRGMEKYLYDYTSTELTAFAEMIRKSSDAYSDLYVYFNNHPNGFATTNSRDLKIQLGMQTSSKRDLNSY